MRRRLLGRSRWLRLRCGAKRHPAKVAFGDAHLSRDKAATKMGHPLHGESGGMGREAGPSRSAQDFACGLRRPQCGSRWPRRSLSRSTGPCAYGRRPISRILSGCLRILDGHSSRRSITAPLQQPTRRFQHAALLQRIRLGASGRYATAVWIEPQSPCLFGLAPCGVYPAVRLTPNAVRSYRTFSPLPSSCDEGGIVSVALAVSQP